MARRILFFDYFGAWPVHNQVDGILGKAMQLRGAEVAIVRCKGLFRALRHNVFLQCGLPLTCEFCIASGDHLFDNLRMPQLDLADYVTPDDLEAVSQWASSVSLENFAALEFRGLPVGQWAMPQLLSTFRIGTADVGLPKAEFLGRGLLVGAYLAYVGARRLLESWKPDHTVIFNGRFYPYRTAFRAARELGIDTTIHERAWFGDGFVFYHNDTIPAMAPWNKIFAPWRAIPLTGEEIRFTHGVLENRRYGKDFTLPAFYELSEDQITAANTRRRLGIPEDVRLIGCFTSSHEEAWHPGEINSTEYQIEFLENLFKVMKGRKEWLVVRHHPHVSKSKLNNGPEERLLTTFYRQTRDVPDNVRIILPDEQITSYNLFDTLDGAITVFSSIGLELVTSGVPTLGLNGLALTDFPSASLTDLSPGAIARGLDQLASVAPEDIDRDMAYAYRYYHWALIGHSYAFKSFRIHKVGDGYTHQITLTGIEDLLPGADEMLDHMCDYLAGHSPLYHAPSLDHRRRNNAEEHDFVRGVMAENLRRRASLRQCRAIEPPRVSLVDLTPEGLQTANRHADVSWHREPAGEDLGKTLAGLSDSHFDTDFAALAITPIQYDLTALTAAAEKLAEAPEYGAAIFSAWRLEPIGVSLDRLGSESAALREAYQSLSPEQFVAELLPRIVWRKEALRDVLGGLKRKRNRIKALAQALLALAESESYVPMPKTRALIG